jgi:hypothetical protein
VAHAIASAVEGAYVVGCGAWYAGSCARKLWLRWGCDLLLLLLLLLLLRACILRLPYISKLRLLWCLWYLLLAGLLLGHTRMSRGSWVANTWVRAMARSAILCLRLLRL